MEKSMRYVYEVYLQKSFSKAAEKLYISQPALSAIVKNLENELHTTLFDRSSKPIRLTDSGRYYIQCVEEIMAIEKGMTHYFEDQSDIQNGTLTIGTSTHFCSNILPTLLKGFMERYPNISVRIVENNSTPELKELLLRGDIDFSLTSNTYPDTDFSSFLFEQESMILAVPKSHAVNAAFQSASLSYEDIVSGITLREDCPRVPLSAFRDEAFITINRISDLYPRLLAMFREHDITPKILMHLEQMSSCYFLAANDFGSVILRASTLQCVKNTGTLNFYAIDSKLALRTSRFYHKKSIYLSRSMRMFMAYVEEQNKKSAD